MARAKTRIVEVPDPFASASVASTATSPGNAPVYIARAIHAEDGKELFSQEQVAEAIVNYNNGKDLVDQGHAMMTSNEGIIDAFALNQWSSEYAAIGKKPENPKLTSSSSGGAMISYSFTDRQINISDGEKERLAGIVGPDKINSCIVNDKVFTLKPDVMKQTVEVTGADGKKVTKTVQEHLADAIREKFKEHPTMVSKLFSVKPVQQTAKGLIARGFELAAKGDHSPRGAHRIAEFILAAKTCTQIKAGASADE
jgi:hypothetical protein